MFGINKIIIAIVATILLLAWGISNFIAPVTFGLTEKLYQNRADEPTPASLLQVAEMAPGSHKKPNIIVILADDLGYGDVGAYGNKTLDTPHIDQLAVDGVRLSSFYSSAPICSPSRAGLLTGRYPVRSGIMQAMEAAGDTLSRVISRRAGMAVSNLASIDMRGGDNMVVGLPESEITIAEALKVAGYRTAAFGKWHLGDFTEWMQYHPSNQGFDHFVGFNMSNDDWPVAFYRDEEKVIDDIGIEQEPYTRIFTESAIEFMEQSGDQPFFIYLSHKDPHQPFFPSEKFAGKSDGGPYGDAVAEFDGSPGGLRGRKGQSYEGGFRVPMVAAWPGHIPAGLVSDVPAMNIDLLPTFLHMAGVTLPQDRVIDGVDIMPVLTGQTQSAGNRPIYFFHDYDVEGIRVDQWKYIASNSHYTWPNPLDKQDSFAGRVVSARNYTPPGSTLSIPTLGTWPLLYRLDRDAGESYNVAKKYPQVAQRMGERLTAWKKEFYANPRGWK